MSIVDHYMNPDIVVEEFGFQVSDQAGVETVIFFSRPDSPLRVDFLKVDRETMVKLLAHSREVDYFEGFPVRVPRLQDLLAMKLFALAGGGAEREEKDFSDIVNVVLEKNPISSWTFGRDAWRGGQTHHRRPAGVTGRRTGRRSG